MSAMHNHAPSMHEHGLTPECPRCEEQAVDPRGLTTESLRLIWYGFDRGPAAFRNRLNVQVVNQLERACGLVQSLGISEMPYSWRPDEFNPFPLAGANNE